MQFIVLGMHRSGTSALARVLGLMGCHVGREDELAPADEHNPKGYWEREDVWALDERILAAAGASWHDVGGFEIDRLDATTRDEITRAARAVVAELDAHRPWAIKDPRLCLTFPLWRPLIERPVCVLVQRDPLEVTRSLERRDGFPLAAGIALWERHTRDALRHSAGLPRVQAHYERLCAEPTEAVGRLHADLLAAGVPEGVLALPPGDELRAFLDPALHREKAAPGEVLEHLNPSQRALYERVNGPRALDADPPGPLSAAGRDALDALARARRQRDADVRLLEGLIADKDRYIVELEQRYKRDLPQLEAMIAEKDRYARALVAQLGEERRLAAERPALLSHDGAAFEAAPADWADTAACTIVSRNYLSLARACCRSFLEHHPGARAFVLVADALEGVDPAAEPFTCVAADTVGVPNFEGFAFKYNILEFNTAVKPYFLEHLFEREGVTQLFYLDPDVYVFGPLLEARAALEAGQIALTPHVLRPFPADGRRPQEVELLLSGTYNLGFLGLRRTDETRELLRWWQERLYEGAYSDPARGMFTDQKWMDLVPGLHRGVGVLRHPGYNAAYWNLHERSDLRPAPDGGWSIGGAPLRFFHFSGFDKRDLERVSKHQDRFRLGDLPRAFRALFEAYARALDDNGWEVTHTLPYAYGCFDNGARVPDFARRAYAALGDERRRFGDPFAAAGEASFFAWLTRPPAPGALSPLAAQMRALRADLRQAFPEPEGRDRLPYLDWLLEHAGPDFGLGEPYLSLLREERAAARDAGDAAAPAAVPPRVHVEVEAEPVTPPDAVFDGGGRPTRAWKRGLRALAGAERYDRARRRVWVFYYRLGRRFGVGPSARVAEAVAPQATPPPVVRRHGARAFDARRPFGVNLFGYFDTESGVGEIARGLAAMLRAAQVPHALVNVEQNWLRRGDRRVRDFSLAHPYAVDLLAVNADQAPHVARAYGLGPGDGRYRIGYWFWELARLPPAQAASAALFDEIWVASDFCLNAVGAATTVPTLKIVPAIVAAPAGRRGRADFGFGDDFVFLFVFDAASVIKRKNPGAVISAFRRAFAPEEPARLVLKTVNATPRQKAAFERLAGRARVQVRDGYVPHGEVLDLLAAADAYVSLHRSEGLGLTLLDALLLGKPVVATRYSGVTEFLDGPGTYPVAYRLVPLRRAYGPYPEGAEWAEADVADAARRMREVYEAGRARAGRALDGGPAAELRRRYSAEQTARALVERLGVIRALMTR
jgi:glycosyltransferase involved in cell wall biosynthesis